MEHQFVKISRKELAEISTKGRADLGIGVDGADHAGERRTGAHGRVNGRGAWRRAVEGARACRGRVRGEEEIEARERVDK
jgi:hypothetical protein